MTAQAGLSHPGGRQKADILIYIPTMALAFGFVWLNQFIEPPAVSAYRDIFINYTGLFVMVSAIAVFRQKRKAAHSPG